MSSTKKAATAARNRRASYMSGAACACCGTTERLELDHINPSEKIDHRIWLWPRERLEVELAKCQWLCRGCHLDKTAADRRRADWKRNPAALLTFAWLKAHGFMVTAAPPKIKPANENALEQPTRASRTA